MTFSSSLETSEQTLDSSAGLNEGKRLVEELAFQRDDQREKLAGLEEEGEEEREGEGDGEGQRKEGREEGNVPSETRSSDVEELETEELTENGEDEGSAREEGGETVRDSFSEIFGLTQPLSQASKPASVKITPGDFSEGFNDNQTQRGPVRPQQIFTSTERSEFVTISSNAITPTREEGTEVVNTTGTPSAEFMEKFSPSPRRSSKATTPQGDGNDEMTSSYSCLSHSWHDVLGDKVNVSNENAASAWPDVGGMEMPKLAPQEEDFVVEGGNNGPPGRVMEGVAVVTSDVSEVGQVQGAGGGDLSTPQELVSASLNPYSGLAIGGLNLEPTLPPLRASETTEGETGQTLPAVSDHPTPKQEVPAAPIVHGGMGGVEEREVGRDGDEVAGGETKGGAVEESTGAVGKRVSLSFKLNLPHSLLPLHVSLLSFSSPSLHLSFPPSPS